MTEQIEIITGRFLMRPLTESDVTERYLNWLGDDDAKKYLTSAATIKRLEDLSAYIRERKDRKDVLFLGIFEKGTGIHIGNIKFEPVNSELGYAIMGVLIGDPEYRGMGVTGEIVCASIQWLKEHRNIQQVLLGVDRHNYAAIRAYEKAGFVFSKTEFLPNHPSTMVRDLS